MENNYNMIISNLILSKKEPFTYNEILEEVKKEVGEDWEITSTLNKCLNRMKNDGFLKHFNFTYTVTVDDALSENKDKEYESMEDLINAMKELESKKEELEKKIKDKANEMLPDILKRINKDIKLIQDIGYHIECDENGYVLDSLSDLYDNESKTIYLNQHYESKYD